MGEYTDFRLQCEIDNPQEIVDAKQGIYPDHKFFEMDRVRHILDYCYIKDNVLEISLTVKNYENEIQTFLDWLKPHVFPKAQVIGYFIHEYHYIPTLVISAPSDTFTQYTLRKVYQL